MTEKLKEIANEIANSRVRLEHPVRSEQSRQDIIDEAKRLEHIEAKLRKIISEFEHEV